ncbi:hypothetical protein ACTG9Q_11365 [Actinokineospora sp. 24-640]
MTIAVRVFQGLLILAGLVACVTAVSLAGAVHDDADAHCYMREVQYMREAQRSDDEVPAPACAIVSVHQTQAISAGAIGLAGIGVMIGAVAMNGMAPRGAASGPAKRPIQSSPSPYSGYGPPPGPPQPYAQGPQPPYGPPS